MLKVRLGLRVRLLVSVAILAAGVGWAAAEIFARLLPAPGGPAGIHSRIPMIAAAVVAGILGTFAAGWYAGRSLHPLIEAVRRWSHGDLDYRVRASGPSLRPATAAVNPLGAALDHMAASLQRREEANRRQIEERILQAERLATTGRLAAGVAHEINNPLGGILLCSNLLLECTDGADPRRENMQRIVTQATRAREIVRGLLDYAHQNPPRIASADLNGIVVEVLRLLERQPLYQRVQVRLEPCPVPLWVEVDAAKIQQVFINIIMNALEAMRDGGALTVRSGFSEREGFCRVAVTDTGYGIPEENLPRVFEPFFTTKEVGKGVGLGLAISHGIVQQHGGTIEVQSAVGAGTTFRVLLPLRKGE